MFEIRSLFDSILFTFGVMRSIGNTAANVGIGGARQSPDERHRARNTKQFVLFAGLG